MSYNILYQRFLVDNDGILTPYIIHGQNNVYDPPRYGLGKRKRERVLTNLFTLFPGVDKSDLDGFLTFVHRMLGKDCWTHIPSGRNGFISMFHRNVISSNQLCMDAVLMDDWLDKNRPKLKR